MKKINKKSPPLRTLFGGHTAPSPCPCGRSGQIICIGFKDPEKTL
jgi:hypothetical protein